MVEILFNILTRMYENKSYFDNYMKTISFGKVEMHMIIYKNKHNFQNVKGTKVQTNKTNTN